jgi:hypothetical protein
MSLIRIWFAGCVLGALLVALPAFGAAGAGAPQAPPQGPPRQGPPQGPPRGRPPGPPPLRIFLDCYQCDEDYLRREVTFVNYVRDRSVADLHVLVTTQSTGGGGSSWTMKFIGLGRFMGLDRTLTFTTGLTATSDDQRREFTRIFKLGLVAYAADTSPASRLDVIWRRPPPAPAAGAAPRDPWRKWLFRTNVSANVRGEESSQYGSYRLSFSGSRTTPGWKISAGASRSYSENRFTISDTREITSISESWNANGLVVKSLTGKWSWGTRGSISNSSFSNTRRAVSVSSGIEYDIFPYAEIERRSLTLQYTVGAFVNRYRELTVFDKLEETVPLRQPWGSVGASTYFTQHLNHTDRLSLSTYGNADVRLFKGFSFYVYAGYSKIKDQIALRKGAATTEEILLRLRQQATNYSFNYSFGLTYSFGSIFTSIVNPRFGNY